MRRPDAATLSQIVVIGLTLGLGIAVAPQLSAIIQSAQPIAYPERQISCPPPRSELEQLHIVILMRDGRLVAECQYYGTRGTYGRRP